MIGRATGALGLVLALAACGSPMLEPAPDPLPASGGRIGGDRPAPGDPPLQPAPSSTVTRGIITQLPSWRGEGTFLIEQFPDRPVGGSGGPDQAGDKFQVSVTPETAFRVRLPSGEGRSGTSADLAIGLEAEVWFVGPIRESYPAQGTAGAIVLYLPE